MCIRDRVDSSEMAFKTAASQAFKKGFMEASPVLLEPIESLKVTVPEKFTGDVIDVYKRQPVYCAFDNEETGSVSRQGAASTFLHDVLVRICAASGGVQEDYLRAVAGSFMISGDNAHAVHPSHPEKADPVNRPQMNQGVVVKFNANQKYTSDARSGAVLRMICARAGVPCQNYTNRSDMAGGSTLGNISNTQVCLQDVYKRQLDGYDTGSAF